MSKYLVYKKLNEDSNETFLQDTFDNEDDALDFAAENDSEVIEFVNKSSSTVIYKKKLED
jgi:hypothetical protein